MLRRFTPLAVTRMSVGRPPWIVSATRPSVLEPPTSGLVPTTPGISTASCWWLRPAGIASTTSLPITRCDWELCTSTIGDSPVTVSVSVIEPTRISALTVAANDPVSSMPSRVTVVKPCSRKLTA